MLPRVASPLPCNAFPSDSMATTSWWAFSRSERPALRASFNCCRCHFIWFSRSDFHALSPHRGKPLEGSADRQGFLCVHEATHRNGARFRRDRAGCVIVSPISETNRVVMHRR